MAEARIYYSGELDHTLRLAEGPNLFGSSFDSDVVLFDDAVKPSHFCITVHTDGVTLTTADGAMVTLTGADGNDLALEPSLPTSLLETQVVRIGITEIRFRDFPLPQTVDKASKTNLASRLRSVLSGSSVAVFMAATFGSALLFTVPLNSVSVGATGVVMASSMPASLPAMSMEASEGPEADIEDLKRSLTAAGFPPDRLMYNGSEYDAKFYVALSSEHEALTAHLAQLDQKVVARIYVDEAFRHAAELAVSMSDSKEIQVDVTAGHLVIRDAAEDAAWRSNLAKMLKRDIPGLKSISFDGGSEAWKAQIDAKLAAVWSGPVPYLILTDGRKVLQGQSIDEDTVFRGIEGESILLVTVHESPLEYDLK